jgi:DNA polymerase-3 subunit alpha
MTTDHDLACPTKEKIYPLHCHTTYSILDGVSGVGEYLDYCEEHGLSACSCTDHGYVMGLYDLVTKSKERKIKGIPGCEFYLHPGKDYKKSPNKRQVPKYFHLTLWAMNQKGYNTLLELSNSSWMEDRVISVFGNKKPRITWEDLYDNNEGLICGSGCIMGPIVSPYLRGEKDMANLNANRLIDIFGDGRLFMEVMPHRVNKDWRNKDIIQVESSEGFTFTFDKDDVILTEKGKMTAEEAMKAEVEEIYDSVTNRPQKHPFQKRQIVI